MPSARHVGIELEGAPGEAQVLGNAGGPAGIRQRGLQPALADVAPGADHVRIDDDRERVGHGADFSSADRGRATLDHRAPPEIEVPTGQESRVEETPPGARQDRQQGRLAGHDRGADDRVGGARRALRRDRGAEVGGGRRRRLSLHSLGGGLARHAGDGRRRARHGLAGGAPRRAGRGDVRGVHDVRRTGAVVGRRGVAALPRARAADRADRQRRHQRARSTSTSRAGSSSAAARRWR